MKDSLITLIVAVLVFYGWDWISSLFMEDNKLFFMSSAFEGTTSGVYSTVLFVANFLAIGGLIYIGVRYLMASAEGKSELKVKFLPIVLGIAMVYSTTNLLSFIVSWIKF